MSTQLVHVPELKGSRVSVRRDMEYNEFRVVIAGRDCPSYYTNDMKDAIEMAMVINRELTGPLDAQVNATGEFDQNSAI